ncbi:MAG: hypothetical protein AABW56_05450 [Nanoarchaeota archaeon]
MKITIDRLLGCLEQYDLPVELDGSQNTFRGKYTEVGIEYGEYN